MRVRRQTVEHPFGTIKSWMGSTPLPDENAQERKYRNGAARPGLQHQTRDAHSGRWRIDGSDPSIRSVHRATGSACQPQTSAFTQPVRLCENSDVELARRKFVSITLNNKRTALAVTVERRKERTQFCAFSARARFHTAWVKTGKARCEHMFSALPRKRTSRNVVSMSVWCHVPDSCTAAKRCHSITSSARAITEAGTVMPSDLAVLRLLLR